MSDVSVASLLTAADPGAAAPAAAAAADPAPGNSSPEANPDPAAAPNPAPAPAAPSGNSFLDTFADAETRSYIERKGFKTHEDVAKSFAHLERRLFDDKSRVLLPEGPEDKEGFDRLFTALGRPETADGYGLTELQGADPDFAGNVSQWLFEMGAPKGAVGALAEKWNAYVSGKATEAARLREQQTQADWTALQTEWGAQFKENTEHFARGAKSFGLDAEAMQAIEDGLGTQRTVKLFADIGKKLAPDEFIKGQDAAAKFGMTKEQAESRMATLRADDAWQARWRQGGADEKAEWDRLTRVASGAPA